MKIFLITISLISLNLLINCSSPVESNQKHISNEHIFDCSIPAKTDILNGRIIEIFNRNSKCVAYIKDDWAHGAMYPELENQVYWNGKDLDSIKVPPGMYYVKITKINQGQATTLCIEAPVDGSTFAPSQAPSNVKVTPNKNSFTVQWNHCDSALGYTVIYWTKNGSTYDSIARVNYDSLDTIENLITGTSYTIEVLAFNSKGSSPPCKPITITIPNSPPIAPTKLMVESMNRSAVISWQATYDSDSFVVYYNKYNDSGFNVSTAKQFKTHGRSDTIEGLENGESYHIIVAGVNKWGISELSNFGYAKPKLDDVRNVKLNRISSDTFEISWDPVQYSSYYIVNFYDATTGSAVLEQKVTSNNFIFKASPINNNNAYCIKACDGLYIGNCFYGGKITYVTLPVPKNIHLIHTDQGIAVTWDRLNSEEFVEEFIGAPDILYCKGSTFDFATSKKLQKIQRVSIDTQTILAVLLNDVNNYEWYTFKVRESNSIFGDSTITTFYSPYSTPVSEFVMPRPPNLIVNMSRGQVFTSHRLIDSAEYYTIYFAPDTVIPENAQKHISHSMNDTIKGLDPDVIYQFTITYTYAGVESDYATYVKIKPCIDLVVDSFEVHLKNDSAIISWETTNSELTYSIIAECLPEARLMYSFVTSPLVITGLNMYSLKRVYLSICYFSYCNDSAYIDIQNP